MIGIKWLLSLLLWFLGTQLAIASGADELQRRLQQIRYFSADFVQTVTDRDNQLLQKSEGKFWLQRPSLFRWQISSPEEMLVISDGSALWTYLPELQQATAIPLNEALDNTPWVLISSDRPADWQRYQIQQQGDHFTLSAKQSHGPLQQFTITITQQGIIQQITLVEHQGPSSQFVLKNYQRRPIAAQLFIFKCPPGVTIDDQR